MKPIPAVDENGEFLSVRLREASENRTFYLLTLCGDFAVILEDDGISFRVGHSEIIDLPAVRERLERSIVARRQLRDSEHYADFSLSLVDEARYLKKRGMPLSWDALSAWALRASHRAVSGS